MSASQATVLPLSHKAPIIAELFDPFVVRTPPVDVTALGCRNGSRSSHSLYARAFAGADKIG